MNVNTSSSATNHRSIRIELSSDFFSALFRHNLSGLGVSLASDMRADFDVDGFKGSVEFTRDVTNVSVSASFDRSPPGSDVAPYDTIELWTLPALFG